MSGKLILGVDGGGSKTAVQIATVGHDGAFHVLGSGFGGPGNACAVGLEQAEIHLNQAIVAARSNAGLGEKDKLSVAVLALAGSTITEIRKALLDWMEKSRLADRVELVHDAEPVIAMGLSESKGVAMIVGTGSVAIGVDGRGKRAVVGGWGHWFGDTGSGYDLGRSALAALAAYVDGLGPETVLVQAILRQLGVRDPRQVLGALGHSGDIHREIATLVPLILDTADQGDKVARDIVDSAAATASRLVQAAIKQVGLGPDSPLALAGGVAVSSEYYRSALVRQLNEIGIFPEKVNVVHQPVEGSLIMARDLLLSERNDG